MKKTISVMLLLLAIMFLVVGCKLNVEVDFDSPIDQISQVVDAFKPSHEDSEYKDNQYVTVTDDDDNTSGSEPVTELVTNGVTDGTTPSGGNGLEQGGANTEGGWGQIVLPPDTDENDLEQGGANTEGGWGQIITP